jgi:RNA polymerase sigma-70 factor (ECF subfamily)
MRSSNEDEVVGRLVAAARSGDRSALDELFRHVLPDLRAFIRLRTDAPLRLRESESDLVQSTCREVLSHLGAFEYRGPARFRSWMFTAALNKIRQKARFHRAERRDPAREQRASQSDDRELVAAYHGIANPCQEAIAHEGIRRFEAAFDRLEPAHQEVILWSRLVGLSHAEIAARMERSEEAVRSLLSRALARLATLLGAPCG